MTDQTPCEWEFHHPDDGWWTSCGNAFVINDGTPIQNDMRFCCYCGHPLKEVQ